MFKFLILFIILVFNLNSAQLHFNTYYLGDKNNNLKNRLLVISGIHGNEPGSYFAGAILAKHYKIKKGSLIVVPNLNFDSIIRNRRGFYGDMNRKFAYIKNNDKDRKIIQDIKKLILSSDADMILNLHDGHGFYRKRWISRIFNPRAWGQACIIDQDTLKGVKFGNLDELTTKVSKSLNRSLDKSHHSFSVKNTNTKFTDEQMQLSLTYFAIRNHIPAVAIETSKNLKKLSQKVKYQLLAIEEFMKNMGIEFSRDFKITNQNIKKILYPKDDIIINDSFIIYADNLKKSIRYFPMTRKGIKKIVSTHPLVTIRKLKNRYDLMCGNKVLTKIYPDFVRKIKKIDFIKIKIDGKIKKIPIASKFTFKKRFKVLANKKYRVNIIGFSKRGIKNENMIEINADKILKRYSMNKNKKCYRIEIYQAKNFSGMILGCVN